MGPGCTAEMLTHRYRGDGLRRQPDQLIIVDSPQLPSRVGQSVTEHTGAYDAFTELSTEDSPTSAPCQALIGISSGEPEPA